jgi:hypothetical protein
LFLTWVMPPWVVRRERVRYRLDNLLFVNSSNSAEDLALSRMILTLWRFCCFSVSAPLSFRFLEEIF